MLQQPLFDLPPAIPDPPRGLHGYITRSAVPDDLFTLADKRSKRVKIEREVSAYVWHKGEWQPLFKAKDETTSAKTLAELQASRIRQMRDLRLQLDTLTFELASTEVNIQKTLEYKRQIDDASYFNVILCDLMAKKFEQQNQIEYCHIRLKRLRKSL